jgi:hypothetical protein
MRTYATSSPAATWPLTEATRRRRARAHLVRRGVVIWQERRASRPSRRAALQSFETLGELRHLSRELSLGWAVEDLELDGIGGPLVGRAVSGASRQ